MKDLDDVLREFPGDVDELEARAQPIKDPDEPELSELAPTMAQLYGPDELERDRNRELVSLARLPSWPCAQSPVGHGWGEAMNELAGGGLCPGFVLAVGASSAGAGKTAFMMQIADGLALRTAALLREQQSGPLTPVLMLSEMSPEALSWRTLARWTGKDSRIFRAGASGLKRATDAGAFTLAEAALNGELGDSRRFIRLLKPKRSGSVLQQLPLLISLWRSELETMYRREVWPVVVLDPIQRWQEHHKNEVEALNELVETLGDLAREQGWLLFMTSDTTKASATDRGKDAAPVAVFRGSYKLLHQADLALILTSSTKSSEIGAIDATVVKNRWGSSWPNKAATVTYSWDVKTGRFTLSTELEDVET